MREREHDILRLARGQGGVVTRSQVRAIGFNDAAVRRRLASGIWRARFGCLVILKHPRGNDGTDACALGLRLGSVGLVTGPTALRLAGWHISDPLVVAWCPPHMHLRIPGVRILRDGRHRGHVAGQTYRMARREEALLDTLVAVSPDRAEDILDRALQLRWVAPERWDSLIAERLGSGRNGARRLRALTEQMRRGAHSRAERRLCQLLTRARIRGWVSNFALRDAHGRIVAELDIAFPELLLCIEVDGRAYHSDTETFERDRQRQNSLHLAGWLVLRFTWRQIVDDPARVLAEIRLAIAMRSSAGAGVA